MFVLSCIPAKDSEGHNNRKVDFKRPKAEVKIVKQVIYRCSYDWIQLKYARSLNVAPDSIRNITLYRFIDNWQNVPYKWGGVDKGGIDCSALMQRLFAEVYNVQIPRTAAQQYNSKQLELFASTKYLSEGDLLFFMSPKDKVISHVGIYLHNHMFFNSRIDQGACIANLEDLKWKTILVAAGRINLLNR
jgi:lipoprotein Spr